MVGTAIHIDIDELHGVAERIRELGDIAPERVLDPIGALGVSIAQQRIQETKTGPSGREWPAWRGSYAARAPIHGGHTLLDLSGELEDSLTHEVSGTAVKFGSNKIYAATQFVGDRRRGIEQRQALGFGEGDGSADQLNDLLDEILETVTRDVMG